MKVIDHFYRIEKSENRGADWTPVYNVTPFEGEFATWHGALTEFTKVSEDAQLLGNRYRLVKVEVGEVIENLIDTQDFFL